MIKKRGAVSAFYLVIHSNEEKREWNLIMPAYILWAIILTSVKAILRKFVFPWIAIHVSSSHIENVIMRGQTIRFKRKFW